MTPCTLRCTLLLASCVFVAAPALAQDTPDNPESGWSHSLVLYLLAPTIEGTQGIGRLESDLKIDPSTVLDTIQAGFLGGWVAETDGWGYMLDVVYMDLEEDFTLLEDRVPGEIGNSQLIAGVNGLYDLTDSLQVMGGLLYNDVSVRVKLEGPQQDRKLKTGESWVDPMIGLRYHTPISARWDVIAFGQVGGFGMGADFTWQFGANFNFRMTDRTSLMLGYRYIDFDYESGKDRDRFKFDIAEHGLAVGFRFDF